MTINSQRISVKDGGIINYWYMLALLNIEQESIDRLVQ
jgi:hypothetical protein